MMLKSIFKVLQDRILLNTVERLVSVSLIQCNPYVYVFIYINIACILFFIGLFIFRKRGKTRSLLIIRDD